MNPTLTASIMSSRSLRVHQPFNPHGLSFPSWKSPSSSRYETIRRLRYSSAQVRPAAGVANALTAVELQRAFA